jgi:hypothetical protein
MDQLLFTLPNKPFDSEAKFTSRFGKQVHNLGGLRHKISDMWIDTKPGDAILALNWTIALIEIKVWSEKQKVNIHTKLRPCQIFWLKRFQSNWWLALVIYYNRFHHKYRIFEYSPSLSCQVNYPTAKDRWGFSLHW